MRKFDTQVQFLKYKVLRETARLAWKDTLTENLLDLPKIISPGNTPSIRCCIYKERAILGERIKIAMGGDKTNPNVIEVMDIACDECPVGGYVVTDSCRGCLAHRCEDACPRNAITFDDKNHTAHIDKQKCVNCGACAKVCPYTAIANRKRPCENACKIKAISMGENSAAHIDNSKCISCGACVYQCPFGAIMDKSFILDAIDIIKKSEENTNYKTFAVVAPSISSQFTYAKLGQVITGLKKLGFHTVIEAALGADMVAMTESAELVEKGFLTSSCCPAFVSYIKNSFPDLIPLISHNPSPMAAIAKYLKETDSPCKVVFIGPCIAKKAETKYTDAGKYVDYTITFEEMQAMFSARGIDVTTMHKAELDNASFYGRIFARCGGLAEAVTEALKEQGVSEEQFKLNAVSCNGIAECKTALFKKQKGILKENFIEGMACVNGCIGGPACLSHSSKNFAQVDAYGKSSMENTIADAIRVMQILNPALDVKGDGEVEKEIEEIEHTK